MGIGNKLNDILVERKITVTDLSRKIDVAPSTIYSIIQRNNKKVDIDVLIKISKILGVNVEYFSDISEEQSTTIAAHKDGENFTEEELVKIEEYKKLLIAARPKE
jgi:plasmid maintenance system antidote protein VapI